MLAQAPADRSQAPPPKAGPNLVERLPEPAMPSRRAPATSSAPLIHEAEAPASRRPDGRRTWSGGLLALAVLAGAALLAAAWFLAGMPQRS